MATEARKRELCDHLAADADRAASAGERVVLTREGAPVAAIVSLDELHFLEAVEAEEDKIDLAVLRERQDEPRVPWEQVKRDLNAHPYARTLAASGSGQSRFTDVSSDKYRHLAEIYADNHDE